MPDHLPPIIKVDNLCKQYGKLKAVDHLSFQVRQGEIFAFLGPNGAGKTTTIKMLTTLLRPTSGEMLVNGFDPIKQQDQVRKSLGIVFQDFSLDEELTAFENMYFHGVLYQVPSQEMAISIEELLKIVDLWDKKDFLVKTFSGGMRRRLEIARALLHHPQIFFLDEPSLGLDAQTRNNIWQHIHQLNRQHQITIFFTTHYLEEAEKMADYIAIIDHGQIVGSGTVAQLLKQTHTQGLEDAYLEITGKDIRAETLSQLDSMRMKAKKRGQR